MSYMSARIADAHDLVVPRFLEEPAAIVHMRFQVLLLACKPKADLSGKSLRRFAGDMHMPAAILVWAAAREDAEVHQQQLHDAAKRCAGRRENHALSSRITIAIEIGSQKRSDNASFGDRRIAWRNIFDPHGHATLQTQMQQEILDRL